MTSLFAFMAFVAVSPVSSAPGNGACAPLDQAAIEARVDSVLRAADRDAALDALTALESYWKSQCEAAREHAAHEIVVSIGRLLERTPGRLTAAAMLVDVGRNLRLVRRSVKSALVEERRRDRAMLRAAQLMVPPGYRVVSNSLRCIQRKIRTGRRHALLCRHID